MFAKRQPTTAADRDRTLLRTEQLSAVTHMISSLEYLTCPEDRQAGGLNDWRIGREDFAGVPPWRRTLFDLVAKKPVSESIHVLRVLAALLLLSGAGGRRGRGGANAVLALSSLLQYPHQRFGTDGADQLSLLVQTACGVARASQDDPEVTDACLWFLAQQSALAYLASGAVKLVSPTWRSGEALPLIMRTHTYGHQGLFEASRRHPVAAQALVKGTLALELGFVAAFFKGGRFARPVLAGATLFHVANAVFMGLGRFVWAFVSTYPAVRYCATRRPDGMRGGGGA